MPAEYTYIFHHLQFYRLLEGLYYTVLGSYGNILCSSVLFKIKLGTNQMSQSSICLMQTKHDLCRSPRPDLLQLLLEEWQDDLEPLKIPLPKGKAVHQNGKMNGNMNGHVNGYSQHTNGRAPKPAVSSEQVSKGVLQH